MRADLCVTCARVHIGVWGGVPGYDQRKAKLHLTPSKRTTAPSTITRTKNAAKWALEPCIKIKIKTEYLKGGFFFLLFFPLRLTSLGADKSQVIMLFTLQRWGGLALFCHLTVTGTFEVTQQNRPALGPSTPLPGLSSERKACASQRQPGSQLNKPALGQQGQQSTAVTPKPAWPRVGCKFELYNVARVKTS